jgi:hypothetical protein
MTRQNRNCFQKIQVGCHFRFPNNSATLHPREERFKQKVFQMTRQDRNCFLKIQDCGHFRFLNISATMRRREKLFKPNVFPTTRQDQNCFQKIQDGGQFFFNIKVTVRDGTNLNISVPFNIMRQHWMPKFINWPPLPVLSSTAPSLLFMQIPNYC